MTADAPSFLPNFLIVGAARGGTTFLYHHLKQHPDVFMPAFKEPHFFVCEMVRGRLRQWVDSYEEYLSLFRNGGGRKLRGEASVFYLYYHDVAIREIHRYLGTEVKIIIVLRNPIERAYSAYYYVFGKNEEETLDFEQALRAEEKRMREGRCSPMVPWSSSWGCYYSPPPSPPFSSART